MKRREFAAGLVMSGLAAPHRAAAQQNQGTPDRDRGDGNEPERFGRVQLHIGTQVVIPVRLLLMNRNDSKILGIDLNIQLPRQDEDTLGLFTPTMARLFAGADQVGEVRLAGQTLIGISDRPLMPGDLRIQNGQTSWKIDATRAGRPVQARLPQLNTLPLIGRLFRSQSQSGDPDRLLVLIRPRIILQ